MKNFFVLPLTLALLVPACSKSSSSSDLDCPAVADKVTEILKGEMDKLSEPQREALTAQMATIRSELIEDCKKDPSFFEPKAACIMKSKSSADLQGCEGKSTAKPAATK